MRVSMLTTCWLRLVGDGEAEAHRSGVGQGARQAAGRRIGAKGHGSSSGNVRFRSDHEQVRATLVKLANLAQEVRKRAYSGQSATRTDGEAFNRLECRQSCDGLGK